MGVFHKFVSHPCPGDPVEAGVGCQLSVQQSSSSFRHQCPWADSLKPAERLEPVAPSAVWKVSVHIGAEVCGDIHMGLNPSQR